MNGADGRQPRRNETETTMNAINTNLRPFVLFNFDGKPCHTCLALSADDALGVMEKHTACRFAGAIEGIAITKRGKTTAFLGEGCVSRAAQWYAGSPALSACIEGQRLGLFLGGFTTIPTEAEYEVAIQKAIEVMPNR
jgi:hypothetical protein